MPALPDKNDAPVSYRFNEFEIRLSDESLWRGDERLGINHRMFQVLRLLIERNGGVVTKDEFFTEVWGGSFVEDNNLTVTIRALRKVLGDDAKQARFIENIPRKGYRFIAPVERVQESGVQNVESGLDVSVDRVDLDARSIGNSRGFRPVLLLTAVLFIALLAIAAVDYRGLFLLEKRPRPVVTLAVLPFSGSAEEGEIFTDGLTESLMGTLKKVKGLRVIERNSAIRAARETGDRVEAAQRVNADKVLTGIASQSVDEFIINVELTDVASNTVVWSKRFRQPANDSSKLPTEIAESVAKMLHYELSDKEAAGISRRPTENAEAYNRYLKGRYYWNKRSEPDIRRSVEFFKQAVDLDPTFALAYVGLADAYALGDIDAIGIERKDRVAMARAFAMKALDIDDTLGDAYASLAINKTFNDLDFAGAEQDYRKAVDLNPSDATAHHWLAELLAMQGRFDESIAEYDVALAIDPLSFPIRTDRALTFYYAHNFDKAIELLNSVKALDPDYLRTYEFLSLVYLEKRFYSDAIDATETLFERQIQRGARAQSTSAAPRALIKDLREGFRQSGEKGYWLAFLGSDFAKTLDPYSLAVAHAKLGDADKAFSLLEESLLNQKTAMVWIKVAPELEPLRRDPRFQSLQHRVGLD